MTEDLSGLRVVVTAGGTTEPIDPVRVITNRSTGKMGLALARAARDRGADVTLISSAGDGGLQDLRLVEMSTVESLRQAVLRECDGADMLVMAAAVSDFRVAEPFKSKIKKTGESFRLELVPVAEFISEVPNCVFKVGFAAETEDLLLNARAKFSKYGYDMVCANDVSRSDAGFEVDTNQVTMLWPDGRVVELPWMSKVDTAHQIFEVCAAELRSRDPTAGH